MVLAEQQQQQHQIERAAASERSEPEPQPEPQPEPTSPRSPAELCRAIADAFDAEHSRLVGSVDLLWVQRGISTPATVVAIHRGVWAEEQLPAVIGTVQIVPRSWVEMEADVTRIVDWLSGGWCWGTGFLERTSQPAVLSDLARCAATIPDADWSRDAAARVRLSELKDQLARAGT